MDSNKRDQVRTEAVIGWFEQISNIPRCSGNEDKLSVWICDWARQRGYYVRSDKYSNTLVRVPGTAGRENEPPVILQAHMDMVCEKIPGSQHDFCNDPISFCREGDWITARETTLGADDGIGVAMALAVADSHWDGHPPLDLLFTVEEETGLTGALYLDPDFIRPGSRLINLDSEDEGKLTVGSAGGGETVLTKEIPSLNSRKTAGIKNSTCYKWRIAGLKSGHSGLRIDTPHGNAIKIIGRLLERLSAYSQFIPVSLQAGKAHNVIPGEGELLFFWNEKDDRHLNQIFSEWERQLLEEFSRIEPDLYTGLSVITPDQSSGSGISQQAVAELCDLIRLLPHGVAGYADLSRELVESSVNLAELYCNSEKIHIVTSYRSFLPSRIEQLRKIVETAAVVTGFEYDSAGTAYPPWQPVWNSRLLQKSSDVYRKIFDRKLVIEVVHAGLECGLLGEKQPGLEMISIGPTVEQVHTTGERLSISSLRRTVVFLSGLLAEV